MRSGESRALASPNGVAEPMAEFAVRSVAALGGQVIESFDAVDVFAARLSPEAADLLALDPSVLAVEPNRVIRLSDPVAFDLPDGLLPPSEGEDDLWQPEELSPDSLDATNAVASWGIDRVDQRNLPLDGRFVTYGAAAKVHVYVIDTGLQWAHSEFRGRVGNSYSAITDGNGSYDCEGHGTHVAGTIAGATYGLARSATVHAVRVLDACGGGSTFGVVAGINWVTANAQKPAVANMSLGGSLSTAMNAAVQASIASGVTYVVAAGNDTSNACNVSPASTPNALTVGASDMFDFGAVFSNYGTCVDISAPGVDIASSHPGSSFLVSSGAIMDGTSMASPHVAGAAAIYLGASPSSPPSKVASVLINSATTSRLSYLRPGTTNRLLFAANQSTSPPPVPAVPGANCRNVLVNGSFENRSGWEQASANGYDLICIGGSCGTGPTPATGNGMAWLGGLPVETSVLRQAVTVPAFAPAALSYWYFAASQETQCGWDGGRAVVRIGGEVVNGSVHMLCTPANTGSYGYRGWTRAAIDLSRFAGRRVTVEFAVRTDGSLDSSLLVDDVALLSGYGCMTPSNTPGQATAALETGPAVEWTANDVAAGDEPIVKVRAAP
jgi:hypothetical protein